MNLKSLEYFIKVVDTNSFTKAAEESFISQSAISQQIKSLEDELGFSLLNRSKKEGLRMIQQLANNSCSGILRDLMLFGSQEQKMDRP